MLDITSPALNHPWEEWDEKLKQDGLSRAAIEHWSVAEVIDALAQENADLRTLGSAIRDKLWLTSNQLTALWRQKRQADSCTAFGHGKDHDRVAVRAPGPV
jgi:hypothetical protein